MSNQLPSLHQAERALLDSEIRLQQVLDNSSAVVFAKDTRGRYLFVNREFERVTGLAAAQMLGQTDEQLFPPALASRFRHNDLRVLQERHSIEFEETADFGSGMRTFISSKFPLLDSNGVAYAVCGMATDITERKHREQAFSAAALAVSQSEEETLYRQLTRYLATILEVDCAFIATTAEGDGCPMQMRAFYLDGDVRENFSYPLAGTPCETVVGQRFRIYPSGLPELFPRDDAFRELGLNCYAGQPLATADDSPLGLISVVSRRPFKDPSLVEATLRIFAVRVNAELERAAAAAALKSSEANYRQIFEASEDAILVHDWYSGALVDVNPRACEASGYSRDELLSLDVRQLGAGEPPYTEVEGMQWIEKAKLEGGTTFEWCHRNKDGSLHWDEVRLKPAEIGGRRRILSFSREITERKKAEEALRASEEQYRAIFNASADGLYLRDADFRIVDVNPAYLAMKGYTREELLGTDSMMPASTRGDDEWRGQLQRVLAGEVVQYETKAARKDGTWFDVEVRGMLLQYRGRPHALYSARDISERKRADEALRASEAQYRAVFNASADALVLWNSRSERVDVNPAYERLYGYRRDEVLAGARARDLPAELRPQQASIVDRTLAGERYQGEIETVRRNGERFPIEVRTIPILHRGEPHVLAMIRDLTERRRVEEDRAQLEAQLRQAQKMEAIGQLTGGIAHDFNNLLTSIMGYVALASDSEPAAGDRRLAGYLAHAQRSCERARDLIRQMLMFSRGQRGSPRLASLATVVNGALATARAGLPGTIELSMAIDDSVPPVMLDPTQVEQVLLNLCINARDATGGTGRIGVSVRRLAASRVPCTACRQPISGEFVELVVEDDGHGIGPEVIERIFEPFFSTKEPGKGSGMGLSMVHGIVHEHGGHVVVESAPRRGARFRVVWPVAPEGTTDTSGETRHDDGLRSSRPALEGSVLVVDDEVAVGEFMRELLGTWGLDTTFVSRPEEALDLVTAEPLRFDVVITDQSMPRLTGLALAHRLREIRQDLPVILYTGHGEGLAEVDVGAARLCAVIRKPIDPVILSQTLARCLHTARA